MRFRNFFVGVAVAAILASGGHPARGQAIVVDNCGTLSGSLPAGSTGRSLYIDKAGNLCGSQQALAASGKITKNSVSVGANASTTLAAANANRISVVIQCAAGAVNIDETGGTLTNATTGGTMVIPAGSYLIYIPPVTTLTAITVYTGTAQVCTATEYTK